MTQEITLENPKNLIVGENSRFRANADLSELMESIKQSGVLQPIVARAEDKLVICGNRRLAASIKLNLSQIPVIYRSKVSEKEMLLLNLTENMQRKNISSIEIGRICDILLKNSEFNLSVGELATRLGVSNSRISACTRAFKQLPAEFRDKVVHIESSRERKFGDLPEQLVLCILNFSRSFKKIDDNELSLLLKTAANENLTVAQINLIGHLYTSGMPLKRALKDVYNYSILRINLMALKTELESVMKKEKIRVKSELISKVVKEKYPNLLY